MTAEATATNGSGTIPDPDAADGDPRSRSWTATSAWTSTRSTGATRGHWNIAQQRLSENTAGARRSPRRPAPAGLPVKAVPPTIDSARSRVEYAVAPAERQGLARGWRAPWSLCAGGAGSRPRSPRGSARPRPCGGCTTPVPDLGLSKRGRPRDTTCYGSSLTASRTAPGDDTKSPATPYCSMEPSPNCPLSRSAPFLTPALKRLLPFVAYE